MKKIQTFGGSWGDELFHPKFSIVTGGWFPLEEGDVFRGFYLILILHKDDH